MTALEYLKTLDRMCREQVCEGCPFSEKDWCPVLSELDSDEKMQEAVKVVEAWAKEHPVKTRQSEFLKMYPNAQTKHNTLCINPCDLDKNHKIECGLYAGCDTCRRVYWSTEI